MVIFNSYFDITRSYFLKFPALLQRACFLASAWCRNIQPQEDTGPVNRASLGQSYSLVTGSHIYPHQGEIADNQRIFSHFISIQGQETPLLINWYVLQTAIFKKNVLYNPKWSVHFRMIMCGGIVLLFSGASWTSCASDQVAREKGHCRVQALVRW